VTEQGIAKAKGLQKQGIANAGSKQGLLKARIAGKGLRSRCSAANTDGKLASAEFSALLAKSWRGTM